MIIKSKKPEYVTRIEIKSSLNKNEMITLEDIDTNVVKNNVYSHLERINPDCLKGWMYKNTKAESVCITIIRCYGNIKLRGSKSFTVFGLTPLQIKRIILLLIKERNV